MTAETLFSICSMTATAGWLLLLVAPRKRWANTMVAGMIIPLVLAAVYSFLLLTHWGEGTGGFSSLHDVAALFSNQWLLLAGSIHYLAFDLFIGAWQARDSVESNVPQALLVPCLILTFVFGPVGLACYLGMRQLRRYSKAK